MVDYKIDVYTEDGNDLEGMSAILTSDGVVIDGIEIVKKGDADEIIGGWRADMNTIFADWERLKLEYTTTIELDMEKLSSACSLISGTEQNPKINATSLGGKNPSEYAKASEYVSITSFDTYLTESSEFGQVSNQVDENSDDIEENRDKINEIIDVVNQLIEVIDNTEILPIEKLE